VLQFPDQDVLQFPDLKLGSFPESEFPDAIKKPCGKTRRRQARVLPRPLRTTSH